MGTDERLIATGVFIVCGLLFGYTTSAISAIFGRVDQMKGNNMVETKMITEYMRETQCPRAMMHSVVGHIRQVIRHATGYQETALQRMPFSLRNQLKMHMNRDTMDKLPFMKYIKNESVRVFLFDLLEQNVADNGLNIVREGAKCGEIVFLVSGSALICRMTALGRKELGNPVEMLYGHVDDGGDAVSTRKDVRRSSSIHPVPVSTRTPAHGNATKGHVGQETKTERFSNRSATEVEGKAATPADARYGGGFGADDDSAGTSPDTGKSAAAIAAAHDANVVVVEDLDQSVGGSPRSAGGGSGGRGSPVTVPVVAAPSMARLGRKASVSKIEHRKNTPEESLRAQRLWGVAREELKAARERVRARRKVAFTKEFKEALRRTLEADEAAQRQAEVEARKMRNRGWLGRSRVGKVRVSSVPAAGAGGISSTGKRPHVLISPPFFLLPARTSC